RVGLDPDPPDRRSDAGMRTLARAPEPVLAGALRLGGGPGARAFALSRRERTTMKKTYQRGMLGALLSLLLGACGTDDINHDGTGGGGTGCGGGSQPALN